MPDLLHGQSEQRHCWLRRRRHRFADTRSFKIGGDPFMRGRVLRCRDCGRVTAAVGPRLDALLKRGAS